RSPASCVVSASSSGVGAELRIRGSPDSRTLFPGGGMNPVILANGHIIKAVLLAALVGLVWRGAHRQRPPLVAYLCATLLSNALMSFWPETFYRYSFWVFKEAVYGLLQFSIAVSIGRRTFRHFPGVRGIANAAYVAVAMALVLLLSWFPRNPSSLSQWKLQLVTEWNARVLAATIGMFCVVSLLVVFFRLPISLFHRRVLLGFTAWLGVAAFNRDLLGALGEGARVWCSLIDSFAAMGFAAWCA